MDRPIVRVGVAIGIALLALGALATLLPVSSSAGEGGLPVNLTPWPPSLPGQGEPPGGGGGPVCFLSEQGPVCVERAGADALAGGVRVAPELLLSSLLAGPTAEERVRGLRSAIPEGTVLEDVQVLSTTFTVRLVLPAEALAGLDTMTVEEMVEQVAATLEPLGWCDLRVEALDPATHEFRSLADFLPPLPAPRKETLSSPPAPPHPHTPPPPRGNHRAPSVVRPSTSARGTVGSGAAMAGVRSARPILIHPTSAPSSRITTTPRR